MKLKKLVNNIIYSSEIECFLESLKPYNGETWKIATNEMKRYKKFIKLEMERIQDERCAYCGFLLNITSDEEIEHIAPKASKHYPQFQFIKFNLVLSCHLCNGRSHKGEKDTLEIYNEDYSKCTFKIVHPYYDDPDEHYDYLTSKEDGEVCIIFIAKSSKARNSIEMFDLNSEAKATERAKNLIYEYQKKVMTDLELNALLQEALIYR